MNKRVLAIIPARGGSKGVPGKNIRIIGGKPLLSWTIEAAQSSQFIDRTILSSDDEDIMRVAKACGCDVPFVRPAELATDEANPVDAVLHAIDTIEEKYDYIVLLQVTSPLRDTQDIDKCIQLCVDSDAESVVSVVEADKSPYWMYMLDEDKKIKPILESENRPKRRQGAATVYELNGAVYVIKTDCLKSRKAFVSDETLAYIMPKSRSLDIDTELDIKYLEFLLDAP
jgi:CMP-N,N'-diacetyllegionaminic acid synthase